MNNPKSESSTLKKYHSNRLLRIKDVIALTNISKSYVYQLCSKGLFPKSIQLVPGGSSVAWVESEILSWIQSRIEERDAGINSTDQTIASQSKTK